MLEFSGIRKSDFQKILFLYCQLPGYGNPYDFVPYKRGAFSFTSCADCRKLIAHGLLEEDETSWKLTAFGQDCVQPDRLLSAFVEALNGLRGDDLIADTYRRFPYYATRSELADRVLLRDPQAPARIEAAKNVEELKPLQTIVI